MPISQPSACITFAPEFSVSNDTTTPQIKSVGVLLYLKRTRNFLFFAEQQKIIMYLNKKNHNGAFSHCLLPLPAFPCFFQVNLKSRKFVNYIKGHSGDLAQLNRKEYFKLHTALQLVHLLRLSSSHSQEKRKGFLLLYIT